MRKTLDAIGHSAVARILRRPAVGYGLVLLSGVIVFGLYAARLGCDLSWDLRNYHYYAPYAFLNGRVGFDLAPAQIQTYLNPLSFVPFYLAVEHLRPIQTGLLFGGLHGISFGILFMIAHMLFASARALPRFGIALACAVMGTAGPMFLRQLGTSYNDILIAPLVLAALLLYLRSLLAQGSSDRARGKRTLILAGLLMGIAAGLKLVFVVWLVAFAFAVFAVGHTWTGRFKSTGLFVIVSLLGFLVSRGYWMVLLWSKFKSPLFPFYNAIFRSPLYDRHNFIDDRTLPKTLTSALKLPFETSDGRFGVLLGVLLLSALVFAGKTMWSHRGARNVSLVSDEMAQPETRATVFVTIFFVVGLVVWEAQFSIARYVIPLELLAPLVVVGLLRAFITRRGPFILAMVALGSAVAVLLLPVRVERTQWFDTYFNIEAPRFENPEKVLVILADDAPMSYVIPFFQPEVRFVCPWSNFVKIQKNKDIPLIEREMVKVIRSHKGPLFVIARYRFLNVRRYGVQPQRSKKSRVLPSEPLSPRRTGVLSPKSSNLFLWKLKLVPLGKWAKWMK